MKGGELDNGDIIVRDYLPINVNTKVGHTWDWMHKQTPNMFLKAIKKLEKDPSFSFGETK